MGKTLAKFADSNQKIVAITAAMRADGPRFFQAQHPTRYFDFASRKTRRAFRCGLATQGLKPFLTILLDIHGSALTT